MTDAIEVSLPEETERAVRFRAERDRTEWKLQATHVAASKSGEDPPPPPKAGTFQVVNNALYSRLAFGSTHFVMGEVRTTSSGTYPFVKITLEFRSSSGALLASDFTYVTGSNRTLVASDIETDTCLSPGLTGVFGTYVDVDMSRVSRIAYSISGETYSTTTPDARIGLDGPVSTTSDYAGDVKMTGRLENDGRSDAIFVKFEASLKRSNGALLDVDFTYVDGTTLGGTDTGLRRGQSGPFTMYTDAQYSSYSSYRSYFGWDDYGTAVTCTYSITPTSRQHPASGGTGSVAVSTQSGCSWNARSNDSWISVTSGSSGSGPGSVSYRVSQSTSTSTRAGSLTIAGRTFTVRQEAATNCTYTVSPASRTVGSDGGSYTASVSAPAGCRWTSTTPNWWITVTAGASGSGNGTVAYRVGANTVTNERRGRIEIEDAVHSVVQQPGGGPSTDFHSATPGIANAPGAQGSRWSSSFAILNGSDRSADVRLIYRTGDTSFSQYLTLPTDRMEMWDNVVTDLFNLSGSSAGTIHVESDTPLLVTARTANTTAAGVFGQFLPAVEAADCLGFGQEGILSHLTSSDDVRVNIGFVNMSDREVEVEYLLYSGTGWELGNPVRLTVPPLGWIQQNDAFLAAGAPRIDAAYASVIVRTADAEIWAYASVIDNQSGDPTTVPLKVVGD